MRIESLLERLDTGENGLTLSLLCERVTRQFRRYGKTFKRQYRCAVGAKAGRTVANPMECGRRKNPQRVRAGIATSRRKKGQRVRKSNFSKRMTASKRLSRMNKILRGSK